jgi:hypothetical protein
MKGQIKSFAVWKAAKIGAIVVWVAWFLVILLMLVCSLPEIAYNRFQTAHPYSIRDTFMFIAVVPVIWAIIAFVAITVASCLYNILSPRLGGIEIEIASNSN